MTTTNLIYLIISLVAILFIGRGCKKCYDGVYCILDKKDYNENEKRKKALIYSLLFFLRKITTRPTYYKKYSNFNYGYEDFIREVEKGTMYENLLNHFFFILMIFVLGIIYIVYKIHSS